MINAQDIHVQLFMIPISDLNVEYITGSEANNTISEYFIDAMNDELFVDIKVTPLGKNVLFTCITKLQCYFDAEDQLREGEKKFTFKEYKEKYHSRRGR
jgi:hypothetical protein